MRCIVLMLLIFTTVPSLAARKNIVRGVIDRVQAGDYLWITMTPQGADKSINLACPSPCAPFDKVSQELYDGYIGRKIEVVWRAINQGKNSEGQQLVLNEVLSIKFIKRISKKKRSKDFIKVDVPCKLSTEYSNKAVTCVGVIHSGDRFSKDKAFAVAEARMWKKVLNWCRQVGQDLEAVRIDGSAKKERKKIQDFQLQYTYAASFHCKII